MVKLSKANLSDGGELVGGASGCFGGGFSGSSNGRAVISNNYDKIRRQRCRAVFIVLYHQLVCRPNVIVISIVSLGRMKCLTEQQLVRSRYYLRQGHLLLYLSAGKSMILNLSYIFPSRCTAAVTAHVLERLQTRGSFLNNCGWM